MLYLLLSLGKILGGKFPILALFVFFSVSLTILSLITDDAVVVVVSGKETVNK
jgi:hypothetical protein